MRNSRVHGPRASPRSPGNQGWGLSVAQLQKAYRLSCLPVAQWKGELDRLPDADVIRPYLVAVHRAMKHWATLDDDPTMCTMTLTMEGWR